MSEKFKLQMNAFEFDELSDWGVVGFVYVEKLGGCARWGLTFECQNNSKFDTLIKEDEQPFTLRFGTDLNTTAPQQSALKTVRMLRSEKRLLSGSKVLYNFKGTCEGVKIQKHRAKDKHWKDQQISEIVKDLIEDAGLQAKVHRTEGSFSLMGCNLPTGKFINRYLLQRAFAPKKNDWRMWMEDGKILHFEPLTPQKSSFKFTNMVRDGWVVLKNPKIVKDTTNESEERRGKIEVMMYDADRDRLVRQEFGEKRGQFGYLPDTQGRPIEREHTSETIRVNMQRGRQTKLPAHTLVNQMGQTIWGERGRGLYKLIAQVDYEPGIQINQLVEVDLVGPFGIADVNGGNWVVAGVKNLYSRGETQTWVMLEKRWEG